MFISTETIIQNENKKVSKSEINYNKKLLFRILLSVFFLSVGSFLLYGVSLNWKNEFVKDVKIKGLDYLDAKTILDTLKLSKFNSYTKKDLNQMEKVLEENLAIDNTYIFQNKSTLWIEITEKKCLALIENEIDHQIYDIDKNGSLLSNSKSKCKKVPLIRGEYKKEKNQFKDRGLNKILSILEKIQKVYPKLISLISEVRLNNEGSITFFLSNTKLRLDLPLDFDNIMLRRLYATVAYFLNKNIKSAWVDLRGHEGIIHSNVQLETEK